MVRMMPNIIYGNDYFEVIGHYDDETLCAKLTLLADLYAVEQKDGYAKFRIEDKDKLQYITPKKDFVVTPVSFYYAGTSNPVFNYTRYWPSAPYEFLVFHYSSAFNFGVWNLSNQTYTTYESVVSHVANYEPTLGYGYLPLSDGGLNTIACGYTGGKINTIRDANGNKLTDSSGYFMVSNFDMTSTVPFVTPKANTATPYYGSFEVDLSELENYSSLPAGTYTIKAVLVSDGFSSVKSTGVSFTKA